MKAFLNAGIVSSEVFNDTAMRQVTSADMHNDLGYELGLESTDIEQVQGKYSEPTGQAETGIPHTAGEAAMDSMSS